MDFMDDDSENDSDFVPEEENVVSNKNQERKVGQSINEQILSKKRKRKVDAIWDELQEEEREYLSKKKSTDVTNFQEHVVMEVPCRKRSKQKIAAFLYEVFGSKSLPDSLPERNDIVSSVSETLRASAQECVKNLKKTVIVQETRRFAGQDIIVEKKVMKTQEEVDNANKKTSGEDGKLDKLIETLKGPKAISTVTKSSSDWDAYKEKEGIADEELVAAKDGFIAKSAFLNNCDVASFEQEKALRQSMKKN